MQSAVQSPEIKHFQGLLEPAGIRLDGPNEWDVQVNNPDLFRRVLRDGTLGLGEAYMDGWWDCDRGRQRRRAAVP